VLLLRNNQRHTHLLFHDLLQGRQSKHLRFLQGHVFAILLLQTQAKVRSPAPVSNPTTAELEPALVPPPKSEHPNGCLPFQILMHLLVKIVQHAGWLPPCTVFTKIRLPSELWGTRRGGSAPGLRSQNALSRPSYPLLLARHATHHHVMLKELDMPTDPQACSELNHARAIKRTRSSCPKALKPSSREGSCSSWGPAWYRRHPNAA